MVLVYHPATNDDLPLIRWDIKLAIDLPLPFLFLQVGIRFAAAFTCGSVRVSVHFHYHQLNSPEWRITHCFTFTFAWFIPLEIRMQSPFFTQNCHVCGFIVFGFIKNGNIEGANPV